MSSLRDFKSLFRSADEMKGQESTRWIAEIAHAVFCLVSRVKSSECIVLFQQTRYSKQIECGAHLETKGIVVLRRNMLIDQYDFAQNVVGVSTK